MCRFTMYLGPPVRISTLLIEPDHSLIRQSFKAQERAEPLNGDGFGVGWYNPSLSEEPGVFRAVTPAWNNRNLESLARVVGSPCVLAHVRAATPGMAVNEANCHPFQDGKYLLMHNGHVGSFSTVRRRILETLTDEAFGILQGNTDSEHLFALFVDEIRRHGGEDPGRCMAECLNRAVYRVLALVRDYGNGDPSFLNIAVSDGDHACACRFTDHPATPPESLYYITRALYPPAWPDSPGRRKHERSSTVMVSSERLTDHEEWSEVPPNHLLRIDRDAEPTLYRMDPEGLNAA
ncbi:MAG: class II glutamine amidotransferase [Gemmatimonadota bacterium]